MSAVVDMVVNHKELNCSFRLICFLICFGIWATLCLRAGMYQRFIYLLVWIRYPIHGIHLHMGGSLSSRRYIFLRYVFPFFPFLAVYSNQVVGNSNTQKLSYFFSLLCSSLLRNPTYLINCEAMFRYCISSFTAFVEIQIFVDLLANDL